MAVSGGGAAVSGCNGRGDRHGERSRHGDTSADCVGSEPVLRRTASHGATLSLPHHRVEGPARSVAASAATAHRRRRLRGSSGSAARRPMAMVAVGSIPGARSGSTPRPRSQGGFRSTLVRHCRPRRLPRNPTGSLRLPDPAFAFRRTGNDPRRARFRRSPRGRCRSSITFTCTSKINYLHTIHNSFYEDQEPSHFLFLLVRCFQALPRGDVRKCRMAGHDSGGTRQRTGSTRRRPTPSKLGAGPCGP